MSRSFLGIPLHTYQLSLTSFPSKLCGQSGIVIPVNINWSNYNASTNAPNQNVIVNLQGNAAQAAIANIRSVYVDNTNSNVPIYVFFPDTGQAITCAPNAEGWFPVFTNGLIAWIIGEGFVTNQIPTTLVLFTNIFVQPFTNYELARSVDLWKASPLISRGNFFNANYDTPSLGDQTISAVNSFASLGGSSAIVLPKQITAGFYYFKTIFITAPLVQSQYSSPQGGVLFTGSFGDLTSTATLQTFSLASFLVPNHDNFDTSNLIVLNAQDMNLKLDATHDYGITYNPPAVFSGVIDSLELILSTFICYTQNPS